MAFGFGVDDIFEELISSLNAVSDRIWFNISDASND